MATPENTPQLGVLNREIAEILNECSNRIRQLDERLSHATEYLHGPQDEDIEQNVAYPEIIQSDLTGIPYLLQIKAFAETLRSETSRVVERSNTVLSTVS